ncbi:MAG: DEAD/DEAH box helicase family protein [Myxococcota bacterium]|nr:DEAD/DEAH box helicase family protein [Myxococcota bacterium]
MTTPAPTFPQGLHFVHAWRPYQARVLAELEPHVADGHLHVVAAPGAGKTILGLEVIRRLDRPALVVTPTLTIRNQWVERFCELFAAPGVESGSLVSVALREPAAITVTTYQALHAQLKNPEEAAAALACLAETGTLVLDEAHHLRNEWWKALTELRDALPEASVLALTATPPFDVSAAEWNRYLTLCGPIDAEISVPELVAAGNLCTHQDYVHLSTPSESEWREIRGYRDAVDEVRRTLLASSRFARAILGNPRFANHDEEPHREAVLADPETFSAMIVFLCAAGHECAEQREFLGVQKERVPELDAPWLEVLLADFLYASPELYDSDEEYRSEVKRMLHQAHAIERRRIRLSGSQGLLRRLRASESKLDSIQTVFRHEWDSLKSDLRLVVLTDHVRREVLRADTDEPDRQRRLGAVPIFEQLRGDSQHEASLCLLTGSLIILPRARTGVFLGELGGALETPPRRIPHPQDGRFELLEVTDSLRQGAVQAITRLFNRGDLHAIVGTAALLAEGWDAQAANTLIMASAVSTHVSSNQMRGRVIRTDPDDPDKVSNIWHLACVEPGTPHGGEDFAQLRRRFAAFEGVSYDGERIEGGFQRLFEAPSAWSREEVDRVNALSVEKARERSRLPAAWRSALGTEGERRERGLVEEIRLGDAGLQAQFAYRRPYAEAAGRALALAGVGAVALPVVAALGPTGPTVAGATLLGVVAGGALDLPRYLATAWRAWRSGPDRLLVAEVAEALLDTLCELEVFDTPRAALRVVTEEHALGEIRCHLRGATLYESDRFIGALEEILSPVENPRFLLRCQRSRFRPDDGRSAYHHAVPRIFSNKRSAEVLARHWRRRVGACDLVYTRNAEGRAALLWARARSWALVGARPIERLNSWR